YPGIRDSLEALKRAGMRLGVVTSQTRIVNRRTRQIIGLEDLVDVWITGEDAAPKPQPDTLLLALERLGGNPEKALMVGDTSFDIEASQAAGVMTGAALWGEGDEANLLA